MKERNCENCIHHTADGCSSWDCEFEAKDLISRADAIEAVQKEYEDAINIGDNGDAIAYDVGRILSALPSANAEQVTSKLKKPCDSLLTDDSAECKEQKSKLEHDKDWIIGCIKHDGFIKTDRFDKANQIILEALQFAEHFDLLKEHESLQEVVRCKDCRYFKKIVERSDSGLCHRDLVASAWKENGYCSRGKSKGGDAE